jgi:hypothetical protein
MKNRKCTRCGGAVTADELIMLKGLMADELREVLAEGVKKWGGTMEDAANNVIDPLLESTPVCLKCFQDVSSRAPLGEWLSGGMAVIEPSFVWKQMRLEVLDD